MRRIVLVVAWMGATIVVTATAWAVVSAVEDQVSDRPLTPLIATTVAVGETTTTTTLPPVTDPSAEEAPTTTTDHEPTTTTTTLPTTTTTEGRVGSTGGGGAKATTTTTTTTVPATTSTTEDTTTTTAPPDQWKTKTVQTPGGTLTIRHRPEEVVLVSTQPATGFIVEIKEAGPPEVKVEFETSDDTLKYEVRLRYVNGTLVEDIKEETS